MPMVRFRLIGQRDDADTLITSLHGIDEVDHVEEVDDLIPRMRDDSSSSEQASDSEGKVYCVEVEVRDDEVFDTVRRKAEDLTRRLGVGIEFVDEF
ncbi:hypothetical protein IHE49_17755 [Rhodanobacter sp. 7MK24]|uniref:hypothetical protein n=1 Tax=Rhodanobacter sp. 7MK24 TaxID=2775922 RepID=UPI00178752FE|nr:hypothetical protein [Rhodanobacter sp. 7MK24]MBD8882331.1 hypothetical protein [Rhodanobacter sp. 7MK24]